MPYIEEEAKHRLDQQMVGLVRPETKGELTYVFYRIALNFIWYHGKGFQVIDDAIGGCRRAAGEIKRRILDPYEDEKIKINGDIF